MNSLAIYIIGALIAFPLLLNIIASYIVLNTYFEVKARRVYQLFFIWLVPVVGALFAIYLNREDYFMQKREKQIGNNTAFSNGDAITHYIGLNHRGGR